MADVDLKITPNSHAYHEKETKKERLKPIVNRAALAKESEISKRLKFAKKTFVKEVLIPGAIDGILDLVEMALTGESRGRRRKGGYYNYGGSYYGRGGYNSSGSSSSYDRRDNDRNKTEEVDWHNIVLQERGDAEAIVNELRARIEGTGQASIGDLKDLVDIASNFTDDNWGWTDPRDIGVKRIGRGWLIDVAEVRSL